MASAALASFQKLGSKVFSSSFCISISFLSTSKIVPKFVEAGVKIFNLIGSYHRFILF